MGMVESLRAVRPYDTAFPKSKDRHRKMSGRGRTTTGLQTVKLRHFVGLMGVVAMLAPMLAVAASPPVPLPRRADRMPQPVEDVMAETPAVAPQEPVAVPLPPSEPSTSAAAAAAAAAAVD